MEKLLVRTIEEARAGINPDWAKSYRWLLRTSLGALDEMVGPNGEHSR